MEGQTIGKRDMRPWLQNILHEYQLYAPTRRTGINTVCFEGVENAEQVCLDPENTLLPARALFLPQTEEILSYSREGVSIYHGNNRTQYRYS